MGRVGNATHNFGNVGRGGGQGWRGQGGSRHAGRGVVRDAGRGMVEGGGASRAEVDEAATRLAQVEAELASAREAILRLEAAAALRLRLAEEREEPAAPSVTDGLDCEFEINLDLNSDGEEMRIDKSPK